MSRDGLTLITPTGDRPEALALCVRWIGRQTFAGEVQWIVVDDGRIPACCEPWQQHVRRLPATDPKESFRGNLQAALPLVRFDRILMIEDDDWYRADYLETMCRLLDQHELVGEARARYYHLPLRMFHEHGNDRHASLCQTGLRGSLLPVVREILDSSPNPQQLDGTLWKRSGIAASRKRLLPSSRMCVGMKGLPGRGGLGIDHTRAEIQRRGYRADPDARTLREWIGGDADAFLELIGG